jgi:uncharacterized protein (DUF2062 family)
MKAWLQRKMLQPVRDAITGGVSPRGVALALTVGFCLSLFPLLGITTGLCVYAAFRLRLNLVVTQAANWIAAPLQIVLLIPFYRYGGLLLGAGDAALSAEALKQAFAADFLGALGGMWRMIAGGIALWALFCIPVGWTLFTVLHMLLKRWKPVPVEATT